MKDSKLREKLEGFFPKKKDLFEGHRVAAKHLRRLLEVCPVCRGDFTGHLFARFAVIAMRKDTEKEADEFLLCLKEHRWKEALAFSKFDARSDAIVANALRCAGRQFAWIAVLESFELFDGPSVMGWDVLDPQSGAELEALLQEDQWFPMV